MEYETFSGLFYLRISERESLQQDVTHVWREHLNL